MLPRACGAAPGATTVVALILESGRTPPFAASWHDAQACLWLGVDRLSSKNTFLPNSSIGSSALALVEQKRRDSVTVDMMNIMLALKFSGDGILARGEDRAKSFPLRRAILTPPNASHAADIAQIAFVCGFDG